MSGDGLIVVDKPAGMTSHDVVARLRRLARTRRVGHGGTLDPMATGVLVIGVGRATRLLTYVIGADKSYTATVRLGQATITDDAEGTVTASTPAGHLDDGAIRAAFAGLTGEIDQVPSAVSAIKINGQRAYKRVREGETVELAARRVTIGRLDVLAIRRPAADADGAAGTALSSGSVDEAGAAGGVAGPGSADEAGGGPNPVGTADVVDVDIEVNCTSGTYIRAIARDAGATLGVGGHLTALRRTAVGGFTLAESATLERLTELAESAGNVVALAPAEAARRFLPVRQADPAEERVLGHGGPLAPVGIPGPYAVLGADGRLVAIVSERDGRARPEIVLAPA